MPRVKVNDVELYYEQHGAGEPLLLIEGIGYATWMWYRQVPELSQHYRVIIFDNRGVGDSDKPDEPYSIQMMADDAAGLLKALGVLKAHILGASMGGYIAQAFAIDYPEMTDKLILACTSFGGVNAVPAPLETVMAMFNKVGDTPEDVILGAMAPAFTPEFMEQEKEEVAKIVRWRLEKPTPGYAWMHQLNAVASANLEDQVTRITAPTLILSGAEDRVVPVENSKLLHDKIQGSVLKIFPETGHLFFIEKYREFNAAVQEFLSEN